MTLVSEDTDNHDDLEVFNEDQDDHGDKMFFSDKTLSNDKNFSGHKKANIVKEVMRSNSNVSPVAMFTRNYCNVSDLNLYLHSELFMLWH